MTVLILVFAALIVAALVSYKLFQGKKNATIPLESFAKAEEAPKQVKELKLKKRPEQKSKETKPKAKAKSEAKPKMNAKSSEQKKAKEPKSQSKKTK